MWSKGVSVKLVHNFRGSWVEFELAPVHGGQRETKERGAQPMLVGDRCDKEGNLLTRLVLGAQDEYSSTPNCKNPKLYTEALTGFSHHPDGPNNTLLSQGCILETAPSVGMVGRVSIPRTGEEGGASGFPGPARGSTGGHILLVISHHWYLCSSLRCGYKAEI